MSNVPKSRLRLGDGSLNSDDATLWEARCAFLDALFRLVPATYWTLFPEKPGEGAYIEWRDRWNDDPRSTVAWWQEKWRLSDPWLSDVAFNTQRARLRYFVKGQTHFWPSAGKVRSGWFVAPDPRKPKDFHGQAVTIPLRLLYWDPVRETRKEARDSIIAALDAELDRIESDTSTHLAKTKGKKPEHLEWLVRYQVLREEVLEIARGLPYEPESETTDKDRARRVDKAIVETKNLIGLTLRRDIDDSEK